METVTCRQPKRLSHDCKSLRAINVHAGHTESVPISSTQVHQSNIRLGSLNENRFEEIFSECCLKKFCNKFVVGYNVFAEVIAWTHTAKYPNLFCACSTNKDEDEEIKQSTTLKTERRYFSIPRCFLQLL